MASHIIKILLEKNCYVRGTVRDLTQHLHQKYFEKFHTKKHLMEFVEADLLDKGCWNDVVKGCDYVIHVASPVPFDKPKDIQKFIQTAV